TREAAGEEEHEGLTHSPSVRYLAKKTGLTLHQAHLVATTCNFLIIVFLIYWFGRKFVPAMLRSRSESIQKALEEARAASADAIGGLAELEGRLGKLGSEIAAMEASAQKDEEAEEARIKKATEEDIRKVVQAAEQEIGAAAKQARRELSAHTAELAVT